MTDLHCNLPEQPNCATLSKDTVRSAEYSYRTPSFPFISIPSSRRKFDSTQIAIKLMPLHENIDPTLLTSDDLRIITQDVTQIAADRETTWVYENRRAAHAIVDFLYLGPTRVIRDHEFLKREEITMVVVVQDSRMAGSLRSVDQASQELGIALEYVRVDCLADLIHAFPSIIGFINNHILSMYHSQSKWRSEEGQIPVQRNSLHRGKVLVTCESGNDRSAAIVGAYIMSVFGRGLITTLQFVQMQRMSCVFDEDVKRVLQTWEDIILARKMVAQHPQKQTQAQEFCQDADAQPTQHTEPASSTQRNGKRDFDDMMDADPPEAGVLFSSDEDRFINRDPFVPFINVPQKSEILHNCH